MCQSVDEVKVKIRVKIKKRRCADTIQIMCEPTDLQKALRCTHASRNTHAATPQRTLTPPQHPAPAKPAAPPPRPPAAPAAPHAAAAAPCSPCAASPPRHACCCRCCCSRLRAATGRTRPWGLGRSAPAQADAAGRRGGARWRLRSRLHRRGRAWGAGRGGWGSARSCGGWWWWLWRVGLVG